MSLTQTVAKFIEKENLFHINDRILIAVSGGSDSMALMHFMYTQGYDIGIAHVNYRLRGKDSDQDQAIVQKFCDLHKIPFYPYSITDVE